MNEDTLLDLLAIDQVLNQLPEEDRVAMELHFRLRMPEDYTERWPPRFVDIAAYVGRRYRGYAISESTIRYRVRAIKALWRGERGPLRSRHVRRDLPQTSATPTNPGKSPRNRPGRERMGDERGF